MAEPLQPLCVSVLESDLDSRKQLESADQLELVPDHSNTEEEAGGDEVESRKTDSVPQDEIRDAFFKLVPNSGKIERETLLRETAKALGFQRLARKIRKRLNHAIAGLVRSGKLGTDWEFVWKI